jgi:hypothetical protein
LVIHWIGWDDNEAMQARTGDDLEQAWHDMTGLWMGQLPRDAGRITDKVEQLEKSDILCYWA